VPLTSPLVVLAACAASLPPAPLDLLRIEPAVAQLRRSDSRVQIVVTGRDRAGKIHERTHDPSIRYEGFDPTALALGPDGLIQPRGDGQGRICVCAGIESTSSSVTVEDHADRAPVAFAAEVVSCPGPDSASHWPRRGNRSSS
jgi:hypothetical protein